MSKLSFRVVAISDMGIDISSSPSTLPSEGAIYASIIPSSDEKNVKVIDIKGNVTYNFDGTPLTHQLDVDDKSLIDKLRSLNNTGNLYPRLENSDNKKAEFKLNFEQVVDRFFIGVVCYFLASKMFPASLAEVFPISFRAPTTNVLLCKNTMEYFRYPLRAATKIVHFPPKKINQHILYHALEFINIYADFFDVGPPLSVVEVVEDSLSSLYDTFFESQLSEENRVATIDNQKKVKILESRVDQADKIIAALTSQVNNLTARLAKIENGTGK